MTTEKPGCRLTEKFGTAGTKGVQGELWLKNILEQNYDECIYLPNDEFFQKRGIDFRIKKAHWRRYYQLDCKHNLDDRGNFYVEVYKEKGLPAWFLTSQSDRMYHINVEHEFLYYYDLPQMRKRIETLQYKPNEKGLLRLNVKDANISDLLMKEKGAN
jgi:hypothetical protein